VFTRGTANAGTRTSVTGTNNGAPAAPSITTQPANQTVTAGQTATFTVVAAGTPPLSYQWKKNGTAISGAASSSYTTPATTSADNGSQFTVTVSNTAGSVTSNAATLTVNSTATPPITTTRPPAEPVTAAYTATLQATGGTSPYTWSQPSGQLPTGLTLAAPSGTISGTPTTAGQYTATIQVQDSAAHTASSAFTITVSTTGTMPQFGHVFIVIGENSAYSSTYNSSNMPYLTSLANQYGLSTKYWADTHPSIGNYEAFT